MMYYFYFITLSFLVIGKNKKVLICSNVPRARGTLERTSGYVGTDACKDKTDLKKNKIAKV